MKPERREEFWKAVQAWEQGKGGKQVESLIAAIEADAVAEAQSRAHDPARVERAAMALCHEPMTDDCADGDYERGICPCERYSAAAKRILATADKE